MSVLPRLLQFLESRKETVEGIRKIRLNKKEIMGFVVVIYYIFRVLKILKKDANVLRSFLERYIWDSYEDEMYWINAEVIKRLSCEKLISVTSGSEFMDYWEEALKQGALSLWHTSSGKYQHKGIDKTLQNSWFFSTLLNNNTDKIHRYFVPFYKFFMRYPDTKAQKETLIRTRKYKLKLNSLQKKMLEKHRHNYRFIYNKAIDMINSRALKVQDTRHIVTKPGRVIEYKSSDYADYSAFDLVNIITPAKCNSRTPWLLETGGLIRQQAVFEAHKNFQSSLTNLKNNNIKHFKLRFKKKKESWTMDVVRQNIKQSDDKKSFSLCKSSGYMKIKRPVTIDKDCKISCDGRNYFLLVPYEKEKNKVVPDNFVCALDPGVRKFQTLYSEDHTLKIGEKAAGFLHRLLLRLDKAISTKNKKLQMKLRIKIANLQKELHHKTSKYLCENYREILLPRLTEDNQIVENLNSKTTRNMLVLGHAKFLELLKTKAEEYENVTFREVTEEYTSQVCSKCSRLTRTSNEIYKCQYQKCGFECDRDLLGSRNILLKSWNYLNCPILPV